MRNVWENIKHAGINSTKTALLKSEQPWISRVIGFSISLSFSLFLLLRAKPRPFTLSYTSTVTPVFWRQSLSEKVNCPDWA